MVVLALQGYQEQKPDSGSTQSKSGSKHTQREQYELILQSQFKLLFSITQLQTDGRSESHC